MRALSLTGWMLLAVSVGAISLLTAATDAPERAPRSVGSRPNIVLILTDDQTPDSLPHAPAVMPYLQARIADPADDWIGFSSFYFNVALCCPSRATILTGRFDTHTGVTDNGKGQNLDESSTMATWLDAEGYRTGFFGKYLNNYPWGRGPYVPPGWDRFTAFMTDEDRYYRYTLNQDGTPVTYGDAAADYSTDVIGGQALAFLRDAPSDEPFFLTFASRAPHPPSKPAPRHVGTYRDIAPTHAPSFNEADVSDKPSYIQALPALGLRGVQKADMKRRKSYEALLAVDEAVHALIDELRTSGELDDTVIIYMTDNGFAYGEHRFTGKACPYEQCDRSPFFVRYPGAIATTEDSLASNIDVAPTIAALAGATPTSSVDGSSLVPFLQGSQPGQWRTGVLIHYGGKGKMPTFWGLRTRDYLYVEHTGGFAELYDHTGRLGPADPDDLENRADQPVYAGVRSQLAAQLAALKATAA